VSNQARGIWVIEFLADGVSSRAIIKKGNLAIAKKYTEEGL
jgi:hypothetical protein